MCLCSWVLLHNDKLLSVMGILMFGSWGAHEPGSLTAKWLCRFQPHKRWERRIKPQSRGGTELGHEAVTVPPHPHPNLNSITMDWWKNSQDWNLGHWAQVVVAGVEPEQLHAGQPGRTLQGKWSGERGGSESSESWVKTLNAAATPSGPVASIPMLWSCSFRVLTKFSVCKGLVPDSFHL